MPCYRSTGAVSPCTYLRIRIPRQRMLALGCALWLTSGGAALATSGARDLAQDQTTAPAKSSPASKATTAAKTAPAKVIAAKGAKTLQAVQVTGIRASIENAMAMKENSDSIIEAISAEDIGKLPDISIAESLARLPGLAGQRVDGQVDYVTIRGFPPDFNGTTLNGREQASTGENRAVEFDQYPAELINSVEVYKTPDASMVGQGIAGTVNLNTLRPLDYSKPTMAFNVRGQHNSNGQLNPGQGVSTYGHRASFSYVDQFFDHTLGVALGIAQLDSPIQEKQYQAWWWGQDNGAAPSIESTGYGQHVPGVPDLAWTQQGMQVRAKSEDQLRNGLMGVIQFEPNDFYHAQLDLYYSKFSQRSHINGVQWSSSGYDSYPYSYENTRTITIAGNTFVTSGVINGLRPILQNEYSKERTYTSSIGWSNRFKFNDDWSALLDLSYSSARDALRDAYAFAGVRGATVDGTRFEVPINGGYPRIDLPVNLSDSGVIGFTDPDNYSYNGREEWDYQKDTIKNVRFEVQRQLDGILSSVAFGVDYSDRKKSKSALVDFAYLKGNGCSTSLQAGCATYDSTLFEPINSNLLFGATSLGYAGIPGAINYDVLGALGSQFYLVQDMGANDYNRNYSVSEKVPMAYLKFDIDTHIGALPLRGNLGVQFVHTKQSSSALLTDPSSGQPSGTVSGGTSYNKLLPSLNLVADLGERQYLRFGWAKTMMRGRIDDEKAASSATVSTSGPDAGFWSGSGGNPRLKPYVAIGQDLAWEKYFGKASYVSIALFNRNVISYVYQQTIPNYNFSGFTSSTPAKSVYGPYTTPQNGSGGKIHGAELSATLEGGLLASWLDGFGLQASFAYTRNSMPVDEIVNVPGGPKTFPGFSKKVGDITFYYEKDGLSLRLAERYRSSFTGEVVGNFAQLGYTQILADKQTDFQAGYDIQQGHLKGLGFLLQVINLTNSPYRTQQNSTFNGGVVEPLENETYGRTVLFGINYKL